MSVVLGAHVRPNLAFSMAVNLLSITPSRGSTTIYRAMVQGNTEYIYCGLLVSLEMFLKHKLFFSFRLEQIAVENSHHGVLRHALNPPFALLELSRQYCGLCVHAKRLDDALSAMAGN